MNNRTRIVLAVVLIVLAGALALYFRMGSIY
jgi:hypothetical protein